MFKVKIHYEIFATEIHSCSEVHKGINRSIYMQDHRFDLRKKKSKKKVLFCAFSQMEHRKNFYYMHFLKFGKVNRKITADNPNTCRFVDL